jgi:hypothetical protein
MVKNRRDRRERVNTYRIHKEDNKLYQKLKDEDLDV